MRTNLVRPFRNFFPNFNHGFMIFVLLLSVNLLTACKTTASNSESLYKVRPWPDVPVPLEKQSQVAEYIVEGKAAYKSCVATIDITKPQVNQ